MAAFSDANPYLPKFPHGNLTIKVKEDFIDQLVKWLDTIETDLKEVVVILNTVLAHLEKPPTQSLQAILDMVREAHKNIGHILETESHVINSSVKRTLVNDILLTLYKSIAIMVVLFKEQLIAIAEGVHEQQAKITDLENRLERYKNLANQFKELEI